MNNLIITTRRDVFFVIFKDKNNPTRIETMFACNKYTRPYFIQIAQKDIVKAYPSVQSNQKKFRR